MYFPPHPRQSVRAVCVLDARVWAPSGAAAADLIITFAVYLIPDTFKRDLALGGGIQHPTNDGNSGLLVDTRVHARTRTRTLFFLFGGITQYCCCGSGSGSDSNEANKQKKKLFYFLFFAKVI